MLDEPSAGLHEPVLQTRQRPALDPIPQAESAPEVAQVVGVGQHAQLQPHLVRPEPMRRQPRPVGRLLTFFDPLLCGAALAVMRKRRYVIWARGPLRSSISAFLALKEAKSKVTKEPADSPPLRATGQNPCCRSLCSSWTNIQAAVRSAGARSACGPSLRRRRTRRPPTRGQAEVQSLVGNRTRLLGKRGHLLCV